MAVTSTVVTNVATNIASTTATLNGYLSGTINSDKFAFDYRLVGATSWTRTTLQSATVEGAYSANITGLSQNLNYEYRAVAINSLDLSEAYGVTIVFAVGDYIFAVTTNGLLNTILDNLVNSALLQNARQQIAAELTKIDPTTSAQLRVSFELSIAKDLTQAAMQLASQMQGLQKDLYYKDKQIAQADAEVGYSIAKTKVMQNSEIDNLIIEASKMQQQKMGTIGAGGLVPSTPDFVAAKDLIEQTYKRAQTLASAIGQTVPNVTFDAGTGYTKAV